MKNFITILLVVSLFSLYNCHENRNLGQERLLAGCTNSSLYLYQNGSCNATCPTPYNASNATGYLTCNWTCSNSSQYLMPNGSCSDVCPTPLVNSTFEGHMMCKSPCVNGSYLFENATCNATCASPRVSNTTNGILRCVSPCNATSLLFNGTCVSFCPPDLVSQRVGNISNNTVGVCVKPCADGQYVLPNGTCVASCASPRITNTTANGVAQCNPPCPSGLYLYPNGTCAGCPSPLVQKSNEGFLRCASPCADGQYVYKNGSCSTSCAQFFATNTVNGILQCDSPCSGSQYLLQNGTCVATCFANWVNVTINGNNYCNFPCPSNQTWLYSTGSCRATCQAGFNATVQGPYSFCNYPCNSSTTLYPDGKCAASCSTGYTQSTIENNKVCLPINCNVTNNEVIFANNSCTAGGCPPSYSKIGTPYANTTLCLFPCNSTVKYLFQNGSCSATCTSPFTSTKDASSNDLCNFPCAKGQSLYPNGTCTNVCNPAAGFNSVIIQGFPYCNFACPVNQSLYEDGTCRTNCSTGYVAAGDGKLAVYCNANSSANFPCPAGQYLYQDKSCKNSCPSPFVNRTTNAGYYCDFPCAAGTYLVLNNESIANGTCVTKCSGLNTARIDGPNNYCQEPKNASAVIKANGCGDYKYFFANETCLSTCPIPYKTRGINGAKYCDFPCAIGAYALQNGTCAVTCESPMINSVQGGDLFCLVNTSYVAATAFKPAPKAESTPEAPITNVSLAVEIRYDISKDEFLANDGINLYKQQTSSVLGISSELVEVLSVTTGSTIVNSQITVQSAQGDVAANQATMNSFATTLQTASASGSLSILGADTAGFTAKVETTEVPTEETPTTTTEKKNNTGLIVGVVIGGTAFIAIVAFVIWKVMKAKKAAGLLAKVSTSPTSGQSAQKINYAPVQPGSPNQ